MAIPKKLHFIWLGELNIPMNIINTWKQYHADWEIKIWTDKEVNELTMINQEIFDKSKKYNQKSDIARFEIIYRYGGVYCDTDIICLKSINSLLQNKLFLIQEKRGVISNSLIGSVPFDTNVLHIIKTMQANFNLTDAVWKTTGPLFITNHLLDHKKVLPFISDKQYDYISTKEVSVYPYYYVNINHDHSQKFMNVELTEFQEFKGNKDEKYVRYNHLDDNNIYAVQLWGGSKKAFYKDILSLDTDQYKKNIYRYILHLNRIMDSYKK